MTFEEFVKFGTYIFIILIQPNYSSLKSVMDSITLIWIESQYVEPLNTKHALMLNER